MAISKLMFSYGLQLPEISEALIYTAMITLMLRRLDTKTDCS
ncbi:hypothetical protein [Trichodesmium erythraeum]|nr:hypothetical protein [Trichodesmium sp. St11_bin5]